LYIFCAKQIKEEIDLYNNILFSYNNIRKQHKKIEIVPFQNQRLEAGVSCIIRVRFDVKTLSSLDITLLQYEFIINYSQNSKCKYLAPKSKWSRHNLVLCNKEE